MFYVALELDKSMGKLLHSISRAVASQARVLETANRLAR